METPVFNRILPVHKSLLIWKTYKCNCYFLVYATVIQEYLLQQKGKLQRLILSKNPIADNVYWHQPEFFFLLQQKASHMGQIQTKTDSCELKGGQAPERVRPRRSTNTRRQALLFFTWISMALVLLQSKILFIIQIPAWSLSASAWAAMWPLKDKL